MMRIYDKYNVEIDNLHAPFNDLNCIWRNESKGDDYIVRLLKCIDDAANLYIPYVVMNPISGDSIPKSSPVGIERFRRLIDYSLSKGGKSASKMSSLQKC